MWSPITLQWTTATVYLTHNCVCWTTVHSCSVEAYTPDSVMASHCRTRHHVVQGVNIVTWRLTSHHNYSHRLPKPPQIHYNFVQHASRGHCQFAQLRIFFLGQTRCTGARGVHNIAGKERPRTKCTGRMYCHTGSLSFLCARHLSLHRPQV